MSRSSLRREARSARAAASSFEAERLLGLRAALFSAPDVARDVLADFAAFTRFDRNGLDADIFFTSPGSPRWSSALEIFALEVTERNMRSLYESAKGWGWDSDAKRAELQSPENRYLVARARGVDANGADAGDFLGFVSFRFVSEAALDVLYVYELQLAAQAQRKGLGKFLMQLCELIARKQGMQACVRMLPNTARALRKS